MKIRRNLARQCGADCCRSRGDWGWMMHFLVFLIYLVSGKTHFDNYHV